MLKIIKTQNGELVNFAHIVEIALVAGEGTNENRETATVYGVIATDTLGKERTLGLYDTLAESEKILELTEAWLSFSTETLFEIPVGGEESEGG